ncbi:MAG: R3H domain-containing nucleic acid-binding protein [Terriglobia bacterium]|nr:R3H domain-containing nucleic acid-binding protein [Terriglobia bacterium]
MPIEDYQSAVETIDAFLKMLTRMGSLRLKYRITAGEGAADPHKFESREIYVEIAGPDVGLVLEHNAELLRSLEHIAAKSLRLEPAEHDLISFDARGYKALRAQELRLAADTAAEQVRRTSEPYQFAPMNSRERRMLHLALKNYEDLRSESSGEGMRRYVVVYPKDWQPRTSSPAGASRARTFGRG